MPPYVRLTHHFSFISEKKIKTLNIMMTPILTQALDYSFLIAIHLTKNQFCHSVIKLLPSLLLTKVVLCFL